MRAKPDAEFPDPALMRAPDGFHYAYATQGGEAGMRNIQVARSADMVHCGRWRTRSRRMVRVDRLVWHDGWPAVARGTPSRTPQAVPATDLRDVP